MDIYPQQKRDAEYMTPHYSTTIFRGYLRFLCTHFNETFARDFAASLPLGWDYLTNENNWVSEDFSDYFYTELKKLPDLPEDFSYRAGVLSLSKNDLTSFTYLMIRLFNFQTILKNALEMYSRLVKIDRIEILENSHGRLRFAFTSNRETPHLDTIAENWKGYMETLPTLVGLPKGVFQYRRTGPKQYEFLLFWKANRLGTMQRKIAFYFASDVTGSMLLSYFSHTQWPLLHISALATLQLCFIWLLFRILRQENQTEGRIVERLIQEHENRYLELFSGKIRLTRKFKEAQLLNNVLKLLTEARSPSDVVQAAVSGLRDSLNYDRVVFMTYDEEQNVLRTHSIAGFDTNAAESLKAYSVDMRENTPSPFHIGNVFRRRKPILISVTKDYFNGLSEKGKSMLFLANSKSFIMAPAATKEIPYGILMVDVTKENHPLSEEDVDLVSAVASQLALCLEKNLQLEKERSLRLLFQKYVSPEILHASLSNANQHITRVTTATVLFSDLRNFTKNSDHPKTDPAALVQALNHYFMMMTKIIYSYGGVVNKFLGDGILAVFDSLTSGPNHSVNAVLAALEMQSVLNDFHNWVYSQHLRIGDVSALQISVGIETGQVIMSTIGTSEKMEYTVFGKPVNVASRLCEISKHQNNSIIMSQKVQKNVTWCKAFHPRRVGEMRVRGIAVPMTLFTVESNENPRHINSAG